MGVSWSGGTLFGGKKEKDTKGKPRLLTPPIIILYMYIHMCICLYI